jgi:hypothetical protein
MPRFFFHVFDDIEALDDEGVELSDDEAALLYAMEEGRLLAADEVKQGTLHLDHRIVVVRAPDELIGTVRFGDVVRLSSA